MWLAHLESGIRASRLVLSCGANARRGAQVTVQRPAGQETRRGRSPGTNKNRRGWPSTRQTTPGPFSVVSVCPCRALATHDPIAGAVKSTGRHAKSSPARPTVGAIPRRVFLDTVAAEAETFYITSHV